LERTHAASVSRPFAFGAPAVIWSGLLALFITVFAGAIWASVLILNLSTGPSIPWSPFVMAIVLWLMWRYLGGKGWPQSTASTRRHLLRANPVSALVFAWSLVAGVLAIVALVGYWVVLYQLVPMAGTFLPDYSKYPMLIVVLSIVMGSLVSPFAEESGFRGYFQVVLESRYRAPVAILVSSVVFALAHVLTHPWPTASVFFLAGLIFGSIAYLSNSIWPGIVVHMIGDATFFIFVWPYDTAHHVIWQSGPDNTFWYSLAQALVFTVLAIVAFRQLARHARSGAG
jgi:membrane protease YdiL (CAAX protease family)